MPPIFCQAYGLIFGLLPVLSWLSIHLSMPNLLFLLQRTLPESVTENTKCLYEGMHRLVQET